MTMQAWCVYDDLFFLVSYRPKEVITVYPVTAVLQSMYYGEMGEMFKAI